MEVIYFAGGCLWGVQEFFRHIPGVVFTEAGRINGSTNTIDSDYDGYAECVKVRFNSNAITVKDLMCCFFEVIDPYSLNKQGEDVGEKYRTGVYSNNLEHLLEAKAYINNRIDCSKIVVEVLPVSNYVKSAEEHQDRLTNFPEDYSYCHIPLEKLHKYKKE